MVNPIILNTINVDFNFIVDPFEISDLKQNYLKQGMCHQILFWTYLSYTLNQQDRMVVSSRGFGQVLENETSDVFLKR